MLSEQPKYLVHPDLIQAPAKEKAMQPTQIVMLKDGKGYTRHKPGPPKLVKFKEGDEPVVSDDLATLWVASGKCELRRADRATKAEVATKAKAIRREQDEQQRVVAASKARTAAKRAAVAKKGRRV